MWDVLMTTTKRMTVRLAMLGAACVAISGCGRGELSGPPELRVGRDQCGECGMLVAEDRSACATLVEPKAGGGRREYVMFDDIGCLLDYPHGRGEEFRTIEGYVRDYGTREWVSADEAWYLMADRQKLKTPMGSGLASFAAEADAKRWQEEVGGEIMQYDALAERRRRWLEETFGG
jgi:copper chaperone NosL